MGKPVVHSGAAQDCQWSSLYTHSAQFVNKMPRAIKNKPAELRGQGNSSLIQGQGRHITIFQFLCLLKADPNLLHQSSTAGAAKAKTVHLWSDTSQPPALL